MADKIKLKLSMDELLLLRDMLEISSKWKFNTGSDQVNMLYGLYACECAELFVKVARKAIDAKPTQTMSFKKSHMFAFWLVHNKNVWLYENTHTRHTMLKICNDIHYLLQ